MPSAKQMKDDNGDPLLMGSGWGRKNLREEREWNGMECTFLLRKKSRRGGKKIGKQRKKK